MPLGATPSGHRSRGRADRCLAVGERATKGTSTDPESGDAPVGVRGWPNGGETCAAGTESSGGRDREAGSGCDAVGEVDSAPAGSSERRRQFDS